MRKAISASLAVATVIATASTAFAAGPVRPASPGVVRPSAIKPAVAFQIYGGGATLPVKAYTGSGSQPNGTLLGDAVGGGFTAPVAAFTAGSALGYWKAQNTGASGDYCVLGSGAGRNVIEGVVAANTNCAASGGFSSSRSFGDFAASDAPASDTDVSTYATNEGAAHTQLVQNPQVIGAIGIGANYTGNTVGGVTYTLPSPFKVTKDEICGVFNGTITTWGGFLGNGDPTSIVNVVYRSDSSGTTFNFSNWLARKCTAIAKGSSTAQFNVDSKWTPNVSAAVGLPANFSGQSGNGGVATKIDTTPNSLGYIEAAYASSFTHIKLANFDNGSANGADPIKNLPKSGANLSITPINKTIAPFPASPPATGGYLPVLNSTTDSCILLVDPADVASVPLTSTGGYPIIAFSYLLYNNTSNNNAAALVNLSQEFEIPTSFGTGKITTIDAPGALTTGTTGFTEPNLGTTSTPSTYATNVKNNASTCIT